MGQICKKAALRVYRELRARGTADPAAFHAAVAVYRHHHPETAPRESHYIVANWIEERAGGNTEFVTLGSA